MLEPHIQPGVTTGELDQIVEAVLHAHGAEPSFKGYNGFTGSICVAVNDVVVHGIPGRQALREGDIIAVDIGARLDGWHGAMRRSPSGRQIDSESQRLMDVCKASLDAGQFQRAGNRLSDVSSAVQKVVEQAGFNVVLRSLRARSWTESPRSSELSALRRSRPGPASQGRHGLYDPAMIVAGSKEVNLLSDGWTIITVDGSRSAQYEHTIAITSNGPLILTAP
ncbi:MAG: M24 family metallopeptidase [Thermomicrobiales bacterium]